MDAEPKDEASEEFGPRCAYCHQHIKPEHADVVPKQSDDDAWKELAEEHSADCEWILTRAHRAAWYWGEPENQS